jgi:hypothetical protein
MLSLRHQCQQAVAVSSASGQFRNAVDDVGHTALVKVLWAHNPKKDLIEILLEHGADPEAKHGGESAIEIAT